MRPVVYFLCTGNAARSVMAATMLRALVDTIEVRGGGTHSIEGLPMSVRTRAALDRHDLHDQGHRSHQMTASDVADADLIVAMEPMHVAWIRRHHPEGARITGTLRRLVRDLDPQPEGSPRDDLGSRIAALGLEAVDVESWETVVDPASGDQIVFDGCADELKDLVVSLRRVLD